MIELFLQKLLTAWNSFVKLINLVIIFAEKLQAVNYIRKKTPS